MNIFLLLNIVSAWYLWKWAKESFERKDNFWAWCFVFFSAWNAAAAANVIL